MPERSETLIRLLHVSDLHVGDIDPDTGEAILDKQDLWWWHVPPFDGFLGHTKEALRALARFYADHSDLEGEIAVVVTGDLTAHGAVSQFDHARMFFENGLLYGTPSTPVGFNLGAEALRRSVPGNHDHWPGIRPTATQFAAALLGTGQNYHLAALASLPAVLPYPTPLANGMRLVFVAVDSSCEVAAGTIEKLAARGSFIRQCDQLQQSLTRPCPEDEIRVLLLHHSPACTSYPLGIDAWSRYALQCLSRDCGIQVWLTGHLHRPAILIAGPPFELRCGTSSRRDLLNSQWHRHALRCLGVPRPPVQKPNNLLLHQLSDRNGSIWWRVESYDWEPNEHVFSLRRSAELPL